MLSGLFGGPARKLTRAFERAAEIAPDGPLRDYYAAGLPDLELPVRDAPLLAIDLETDGLDQAQSAILESGSVPMTGQAIELGNARRIRFRPDSALKAEAVVIHRITDDALVSALDPRDALAQVLDHCAGRVLVAHFSEIESGFLDAACRRIFGAPFVAPFICTMRIETRWFPRARAADGLRLGKLRSDYGLPSYQAHDGLTDALACGELLLAQIARTGREHCAVKDMLHI